MLQDLKIKNFRLLKDFTVNQLGRINLIVGKNNSGKSSVLEGLRILAHKGRPETLTEILGSHDEYNSNYKRKRDPRIHEQFLIYQFRDFFPGRIFPQEGDSKIYIGDSTESNFITIDHILYREEIEELDDPDGEVYRRRKRVIVDKSNADPLETFEEALVISSEEEPARFLDLTDDMYRSVRSSLKSKSEIPLSYIPTQFLSLDVLADLWDKTIFTQNFDSVREFLRIISPDFEDLAFVKRPYERRASERMAIVKLTSQSQPIPLNSMGDGMLRVLQLVLGLFPAADGMMLIDEFENGLHYSIQEMIWELIFEIAERLSIQIFATTHSWDCIEAFKKAALKHKEAGVLFRVGRSLKKSDQGKVISTLFDEEQLSKITQSDVEIR